MRISRFFVCLFFLGGLALYGVMIWRIGLAGLFESFQAIGLWIIPYLLIRSVRFLLHTAAWIPCFPGNRLPIPFWHLLLVSRAGGAINKVTPTASVGGEVVKVLLLESQLPREQAAAMVVIDKASSTLAKMFYVSLGLFYLMQRLPLSLELYLSLTVSIGLITLGLIGFVAFQRYGLLSDLVRRLGRYGIGGRKLQGLLGQLVQLDTQLVSYYTGYRWRFLQSLLLHFAANAFNILKTYILLRLLLGAGAPDFADAAMVAIAVNALDQMFFFVPGRVGTLEGVRLMVLSFLGVAKAYGLAYGLVARVEQLFWSGVGLIAYWVYTHHVVPDALHQPVEASPRP
jgi:hypothetical protein